MEEWQTVGDLRERMYRAPTPSVVPKGVLPEKASSELANFRRSLALNSIELGSTEPTEVCGAKSAWRGGS